MEDEGERWVRHLVKRPKISVSAIIRQSTTLKCTDPTTRRDTMGRVSSADCMVKLSQLWVPLWVFCMHPGGTSRSFPSSDTSFVGNSARFGVQPCTTNRFSRSFCTVPCVLLSVLVNSVDGIASVNGHAILLLTGTRLRVRQFGQWSFRSKFF